MNSDLFQSLIGKKVQVKIEGHTIEGLLCSIDEVKETCILVVQSSKDNFTLAKGNVESLGENPHV